MMMPLLRVLAMGSFSRGIKAGLAAGVVYAAMVGLLHTGTLSLCSSYQISFIQTQIATVNPTTVITEATTTFTTTSIPNAQNLFDTDLIVFSLYWAIGALFVGVVYGAFYGLAYERLPGATSKRKGLFLSIFVFIIGIILGLSGWEIGCSPGYYHVFPVLASVPISAAYGYLLGLLYDSFGAVEQEEREIARQKEEEKRRKDNANKEKDSFGKV